MLILTFTGAPAASARALGLKALRKGIAAKITPTNPSKDVIEVSNCRLIGLGGDFGCIKSIFC